MKIKLFFLLALFSFLLFIALSPIRGFVSFKACALTGFMAYFFFTSYCYHRFRKTSSTSLILIAIFVGSFAIELPFRMRYFTSSLISLPDSILHFLGIVFGYLHSVLIKPQKWATTTFGLLIALFMYFSGYDLWIHKLNFGTFTGHVSYKLPARFEAFDQSKALITDRDLDGKVVLLDFWHTRCGACFKKFPELQRLFDEYKANPSVAILAVDKPLEDDAEGQAFQMIKEEKYTFPVVVAKNENLPELYDVEVYPTTMVINRQGTVVFRGRIEDAARQVEKLISAR